ncbi:MAG: ABC transporter substrate-binding protein [Desulfarculaceae bacterium]
MSAKRLMTLLGVALVGLALVAGSGVAVQAKSIKIGVGAPLTGDAAAYGDNILAGVSLKVAEINKAGGIKGAKVEIVKGDDLCAPKEAGTVATKFANDKNIVAVIGHVCSSATLAGMPIYIRKGMPVISATSTNATIGKISKGWFFRNCYTDDYQAAFLAEYVKKILGLKKVGVFYEQNDYAIGLKDSFVKAAKGLGLGIVGTEAYTRNTTDYGPQITKLKAGGPDGIFISGYYQQGALIARQARKAGFKGALFGADGLDNADYIKLAGKDADGTYMSVPFLAEASGPAGQGFVKKFKASAKRDPDWMSANAYDCMGILAAVIAKVGADRKKIRDGLAAYNAPGKAFKGITGATFFDKHGDCQKPAFVKMVKSGKFVPAKQMQ